MRNPIQKRIANLESWQHITFMLCLCERMYPNFHLFCQLAKLPENAKTYQNILHLIWEFLTVKDAKINFESQLEKLEAIIPNTNDYNFYGVFPAEDACYALSELLHAIIAGSSSEQSVKLSHLSLQTVKMFLETHADKMLTEQQLKENEYIQQELDEQWQIYRVLKQCKERNIGLLKQLKLDLKKDLVSNIGIKID